MSLKPGQDKNKLRSFYRAQRNSLTEAEQELAKQQQAMSQSEEIRKSQEAGLATLQKKIAEQATTLTAIQSAGGTLQAELTHLQKDLTAKEEKILQAVKPCRIHAS